MKKTNSGNKIYRKLIRIISVSLASLLAAAGSAQAAALPASYDLRTEGIITDIKDQGYSGACWAFSALKAAESNAIKRGLVSLEQADFSENHLSWFSFHASGKSNDLLKTDGFYPISSDIDAAYRWGGSSLIASFTMARWSGIVTENTAPFTAGSSQEQRKMAKNMKESGEKLRYQANYHMQNATCYDNAGSKTIKQALLEKGALSLGLYYSKKHLVKSGAGTTYYQTDYLGKSAIRAANHCVTVVGWDDTFSRTNFPEECRPTSDGAWLIANSYGTSVGDNGYFWLSYQEPSICEIYSFEVESADNYDTNYQYDGFGWGSALVGNNAPVKGANIFKTTESYNQSLKAVGLYTIEDGQSYTIQIYKNVTGTKPTSGTLVSASTTKGTIPYNGFHTIPLKTAVNLGAGSRFSVVVTYSGNPNGKNYLPIEGESAVQKVTQSRYSSKKKQSYYYSTSSKKWLDIAANGYNNLCVKAFASNTSKTATIKLTETKLTMGKGESYAIRPVIKNAGGQKPKYKSSKTKVASVSKSGKIKAKRTGKATIQVKLGQETKKISLKVKKAPASIRASKRSVTIRKGKNYRIKTSLSAGSASHKLSYRSSKTSIASVDKAGKISAKKRGTAVIRIKTYNNKKTKITVRVK